MSDYKALFKAAKAQRETAVPGKLVCCIHPAIYCQQSSTIKTLITLKIAFKLGEVTLGDLTIGAVS